MTWKAPLIPKTTENQYTGNAPTRADLDKRLETLNEQYGRPVPLAIRRDSVGAWVLVQPTDIGDHEMINLGKTVAQAHRALCVIIDVHHAMR